MFTLATMVTALFIGASAPNATAPTCVAGQKVCSFDGPWDCSIPWLSQAVPAIAKSNAAEFYRDRFAAACVRHQQCYREGLATYGLSRTRCDDAFHRDMQKRCVDIDSWSSVLSSGITSAECDRVALAYYRTVKGIGGPHYSSGGNVKCYYDLRGETAQVHSVGPDGRLGAVLHGYRWPSGWWVSSGFTATVRGDNLLLLNPKSGAAQLHRPIENGAVAATSADYEWGAGWTTVKGYRVGGQKFLFLLSADTGLLRIHAVKPEGSVGARIQQQTSSAGFTSAEFYEVGGKTYLFLMKGQDLRTRYVLNMIGAPARGGSGLARVHEMNRDGTLGEQVRQYDWPPGWSLARAFKLGARSYMLFLNSGNGAVRVDEIRDDGTLGKTAYAGNWLAGWTIAEPYEVNARTFVFLMKPDGSTARVYELRPSGAFASYITEYSGRTEGWTSTTFFRASGRVYALFMTAADGGR